ncbi:MAG: DNA gyrase subunit A [Euryarchaeota archaeon]|nr:DNA gyrase subunit A [Euryarchaeota archaeon]
MKPRPIEQELKTAYLDYSMSVIVGRAIPDVRDGLKPVHRRILYAMKDLGLTHTQSYKKSARVVGEVLGKYHPHGDSAVYDAMVRMAQDFSLRYPLVDGQGNFGSVDGDSAAAMRYTEARLAKIASELLEDLEKETVDFVENFDGTLEEPSVMPARLPNLLLNGSDGIAVGMATKIPPHNLTEVCDGIIRLIDQPEATVPELMEHVKAPDFPTGGIICGTAGIYSAYMTGRGRVVVRAKVEVEERGADREAIIVTELPYQVNKANLLISIANLVKEKRIEGISDLRDESDRHGMRVVVELKKGAIADLVLNQLYAHTTMQTSFGVLNLVLDKGQPKVMDLRETIQAYIGHREDVVTRRTQYELRKAEEKLHLLEGYLIALDNIEAVIALIRGSESPEVAKHGLMERFRLSELQAKAILDMRLSKLTSLEVDQVKKDHEETTAFIERCKEILGDRGERMKIIREEVVALRDKYGDARRTEITESETDIIDEDLIPREHVIVTMTRDGYIKRLSMDTYRAQHRGGKGLRGLTTKQEDQPVLLFTVHSHDWVMFFTDQGRVHWLKGYRIPEGSRQSKGKAIVNLLEGLQPNERILTAISTSEFPADRYAFFTTKNGTVKRTQLSAFKNVRTAGVKAIVLDEDDELIDVRWTDGEKYVFLASKNGQAVTFREEDVRVMGRVSRGVRGMRLRKGDEVVSLAVFPAIDMAGEDNGEEAPEAEPVESAEEPEEGEGRRMTEEEGPYVLTLSENGFGKATPLREYRLTRRGGLGVKNFKVAKKTGPVAAVRAVVGDEDILLLTTSGMMVRTSVDQIRVTGRAASGVIVMRMGEDDRLRDVALVPPAEEGPTEELRPPPSDVPPSSGEDVSFEDTEVEAGTEPGPI